MNWKSICRATLLLALAIGLTGCKSAADAKYDEGKNLAKRGMYPEAILAYEEAGKLYAAAGKGSAGRAWEKIGTIYKEQGQQDKAIKYFEMSVADDPARFKRYQKLIRAYTLNRQYDEARGVYERLKKDEKLANLLRYERKDEQAIEAAYQQIAVDEEAARQADEQAAAGASGGGAAETASLPPATPEEELPSLAQEGPALSESNGAGDAEEPSEESESRAAPKRD